MGKSKVRTLLTACVMIMLCAAMIVGGTYALWSDKVEVNNHLSAGMLKVSLQRTYLEKYTLGDDMYMTKTTDDTIAPATANIFGMGNEVVVPTSYYAARLKLTNDGDVAINYEIKVVVKNDSDKELAKQVKVFIGEGEIGNVTYDEGKYLVTETDGNVTLTQFTIGNGFIDKNQTGKVFWVKIVFENRHDNNAAQNKRAEFDLLVTATQRTTRTT